MRVENKEQIESGDSINKTQLYVETALSRLVNHRDINAHFLRWHSIVKEAIRRKGNAVVLDVGCGIKMSLAFALYTNRAKVAHYHGCDVRNVEPVKVNFPVTFHKLELGADLPKVNPDIITNFEVLEHMSKDRGIEFLKKIYGASNEDTIIYISTPCYDGKTKADNHVYEWRYEELKEQLEKDFTIEKVYGTFMHTTELEKQLEGKVDKDVIAAMRGFFSTSTLSNIFAPYLPEQSRNCFWILKKKSQLDLPL